MVQRAGQQQSVNKWASAPLVVDDALQSWLECSFRMENGIVVFCARHGVLDGVDADWT